MQKLALPLEVKSLQERQFSGYGSVFGNVDLGDDVVVAGAFKRTLAERKASGQLPVMLWSHDPTKVAGKWLDMKEDSRGLHVRGELAPTPLGDEIHTLMKMEAVSGMSIGFVIKDQEFTKDGLRMIKEVDLWELSVCAMPMNPLARVANVKTQTSAFGEYVPTPKEFERILRDAGCSRKTAKELIHLWMSSREVSVEMPETPQREAGTDEAKDAAARIADMIMAEAIRKKFQP